MVFRVYTEGICNNVLLAFTMLDLKIVLLDTKDPSRDSGIIEVTDVYKRQALVFVITRLLYTISYSTNKII